MKPNPSIVIPSGVLSSRSELKTESRDLVFLILRFARRLLFGFMISGSIIVFGQEEIDLTGISEETRFGTAYSCNDNTSERLNQQPVRKLHLSLFSSDARIHKLRTQITFELTVKNDGEKSLLVPPRTCSKESAQAAHAGDLEACINLTFVTPSGEKDWFAGSCLCGSPVESKQLKPGESLKIRDTTRIVLTDAAFYHQVRSQPEPWSLTLTPEFVVWQHGLEASRSSKDVRNCVRRIPMQSDANSFSVNIGSDSR